MEHIQGRVSIAQLSEKEMGCFNCVRPECTDCFSNKNNLEYRARKKLIAEIEREQKGQKQ